MLTPLVCSARPFHYQRRFYRETPFPDRYLVETFKKRHENTPEVPYTYDIVLKHPKTISSYWKISQMMHQKRMIPFVHGQSVVWSISERILKALGYDGCQLFRFDAKADTSSEILERITKIIKEREAFDNDHPIRSRLPFFANQGILDHEPELRDRLLAVTIGIFHLGRKESPCSFVFGGLYGGGFTWVRLKGNDNVLDLNRRKEIVLQNISKAMEIKGYDKDTTTQLLKNVGSLCSEAAVLPFGQFIVCGVPYDKLNDIVYHCGIGGVPTGVPMNEVVDDCSRILNNEYQARLMFCSQAMSDVEIVNVMDDHAVMEYCEGLTKGWEPHQEACLKDVLIHQNCEDEDFGRAQIGQFYRKIDKVIDDFQLKKN